MASRCSGAAASWCALRGWTAAGMKTSRSSDNASNASPAASKCPLWGGSKLPPRSPIRTDQEPEGGGLIGGAADESALVESGLTVASGAFGTPTHTFLTSESFGYR